MRMMLLAFAAVVLIAIVANFGLENAGFSSQKQDSSQNVRLN